MIFGCFTALQIASSERLIMATNWAFSWNSGRTAAEHVAWIPGGCQLAWKAVQEVFNASSAIALFSTTPPCIIQPLVLFLDVPAEAISNPGFWYLQHLDIASKGATSVVFWQAVSGFGAFSTGPPSTGKLQSACSPTKDECWSREITVPWKESLAVAELGLSILSTGTVVNTWLWNCRHNTYSIWNCWQTLFPHLS